MATAPVVQAPCVRGANAKIARVGVARPLPSAQPARSTRSLCHRRLVCSAQHSLHRVHAAKAGNTYSPVLRTEEAQADLRFSELLDGQNKIIVVSAVAPGSSAEKAGIKVGQQVLGISDPVNENQVLSLKSKPSKIGLSRALNMRSYPEVELEFDAEISPAAQKIIDSAGGGDVYKALQANEVETSTSSQESTSSKRNEDKAQFMSRQTNSNSELSRQTQEEAGKNKKQFALVAGIGFFIIPLAFVAIAIWSGYLDSLQGGV